MDPLHHSGDHLLQEIHEVPVVHEGHVGLEHRELGAVPCTYPLVSEVAVYLEDPVVTAYQQPLEVELRSDPQIQVHTERVVVGHKLSLIHISEPTRLGMI